MFYGRKELQRARKRDHARFLVNGVEANRIDRQIFTFGVLQRTKIFIFIRIYY
jgi:hypothetical protein